MQTKPETPARPDGSRVERRRRRLKRPVAFLLALGFFFGPAGAFVLGQRPVAFENHALAEFPSLSDGWDFFPNFTSWAVDHLPLRDKAVNANAQMSQRVFGEAPSFGAGSAGGPLDGGPADEEQEASPYAPVIQGEDGWLYFGADVEELCEPNRSVQDTLDRLDRLAAAVEASGRRFVLVVAPDKSTMVPQYLPETYYGQDCATARRDEFWSAMDGSPPSGYVDLRADLSAAQERTGEPVYRQTDTHWTTGGAAVYAENLADALDPDLWGDTEVADTGTTRRTGDLGPMIGQPHEDEYPAVEVRRPGVAPVGREGLDLPEMPYTPVTLTNETTGASLFEPATLLLGDSFTSASRQALGSLFADVTLLHGQVAGPFPEAVAGLMSDADAVVYEVVERTIAGGDVPLLEDASLDAIEAELAANPLN
jgi:hypothetical protein